jgi:serine/threonine protein kinase/Tfp pilus assembly protein PilF
MNRNITEATRRRSNSNLAEAVRRRSQAERVPSPEGELFWGDFCSISQRHRWHLSLPRSSLLDGFFFAHYQDGCPSYAGIQTRQLERTVVGQILSHYKIVQKLGEGGMGVVYKGEDLKLGRPVALKFLPARSLTSRDEIARFEQEAKAISALADTRIATIYDIGEAEGEHFLVLEYLPGGTLKEKLREVSAGGGELSLGDVLSYAIQIAEGLSHAHRRGIIHRDVKTDNVMLTESGTLKITDFGLAKLKGGANLTRTGSTVGTAAYMSPEQINGEDVDQRSDVFSFGVLLYELLTSRLPFRGEHEAALLYAIMNEEPPHPIVLRPGIPVSLDSIVRRCLEKDRAKRFQSMDEVAAALREVQPEQERKPARLRARRLLPRVLLGGMAVLAGAALLLYSPWKSSPVERKSIAVLPFKNMSEERASDYFSDGITEDIIAQLSKIGDLRVLSRNAVMGYKKSEKSIQEIARELHVPTILEGSVRRSGTQVHVVAELIDAGSNEDLWAETYDKQLTEIFAIQSTIAHDIASALKTKLSPEEARRIDSQPTENVDAYTHYLRGREYYGRYHRRDNDSAIVMFKKALDLDPRFALAYTGLGDAYGQRVEKFGYPDQWLDSSIAASRAAISFDPTLAEAQKSLALGYTGKGWLRKARIALGRAVQLNPNYDPAVGNIGFLLMQQGKLNEAIPWYMKSIAIDPSTGMDYFGIGEDYVHLGEYEKAEEWLKRGIELQPTLIYAYSELCELELTRGNFPAAEKHAQQVISIEPNDILGINCAGDVALFQGKLDEARRFFERGIGLSSRGMAEFAYRRNTTRLGYVLIHLGQAKMGMAMLDESMRKDREAISQGDEWYANPFDLACIYAIRGEKDQALQWLQKALDAGWTDYVLARKDPVLESLKTDGGFLQLTSQAEQRVLSMRERANESENPLE